MKEKITLFIALSFVLSLTVYKTYTQNDINPEDGLSNNSLDINEHNLIQSNTEPDLLLNNIINYTDSEKSRAQKYIDKNWAPDETINEIAYRDLGGEYTNYWGDKIQVAIKTNVKEVQLNNKEVVDLTKEKIGLVQN